MPSAGDNTSGNGSRAPDAWRERAIEDHRRAHQMLEAEYENTKLALDNRNEAAQRLEREIKRLDDLIEAERQIMSDIGRSAWTDRIQSEEWHRATGRDGARIKHEISRLAYEMKATEGRFQSSFNRIEALRQSIEELDALLANE